MFDDVKSQDKAKSVLQNLLATQRFPHALLFHGPRGIGKMKLAKSVVKYFNCQNKNPEEKGMDACSICQRIDNEIYPDCSIIRTGTMKKRSGEVKESKEIKKEQITDIIKQIKYKPFEGEYKFFIIDGAELMNSISENAFLKTLEEPLENNFIILICHNINIMLPTILSRCIKIKCDVLPIEILSSIIKEHYNLDPDLCEKIAVLSDGSMHEAELLMKDDMYKEIFLFLDEFINCLSSPLDIEAITEIGVRMNGFEQQYIEYIFDLLLIFIQVSFFHTRYDVTQVNFFKYYLNFKTKSIKLNSYNNIINEIIKAKYYVINTNVDVKLLVKNLIISIRKSFQ